MTDMVALNGSEHASHGANEALEPVGFDAELAKTGSGNGVVPRAAPRRRRLPVPGDEPLSFEALEGRIQRAWLRREHAVRQANNVLGNGVAVHRLSAERAKDDEVKGPVEQVRFVAPRHAQRYIKSRLVIYRYLIYARLGRGASVVD
jgi:hypothetical protein